MTVNLLSMQNYEEVGGCDVGSSFIHEFREGYYGIKLFPNQGYSEYNQNTAHNMTTLFENNKIYPKAGGTRLITESVFTPPWYRRTCEETCYWELNGKKIYWTIKHTTIGK